MIDFSELSRNPLAEMYKNALERSKGKCWDCGEPIEEGDYCSDCEPEGDSPPDGHLARERDALA